MRSVRAFTLIELLAVLAIVALMLTIAAPRYIDHVERSRETALKSSLKVIREALDKFEADVGRPVSSIEELVDRRYLSAIPIDPITDRRDTWVVLTASEVNALRQLPSATASARAEPDSRGQRGADAAEGVADVRSGAAGVGRDGRPYKEW
jgi:prepilin-type N-terminal cleavage/methylation domain-containing protein